MGLNSRMRETMLHSVAGRGLLHFVPGDCARVTRPPEHHSAVRIIVVSHGRAQSRRELPVLLIIVSTPAPCCGGVVTIFSTSLDWSYAQSIDTLNALIIHRAEIINTSLTLLVRLLPVLLARDVSGRRHLVTPGGHSPGVTPGVIHRQTRRMHHAPRGRVTPAAYAGLARLSAVGDVGLDRLVLVEV